ncbi:4Fe-4S dicluster domain-containing protein [Streptomyces sp. PsTaAH-137]|uniref:4Fe-4S dicluster domain-containing protein n=1 Tax=Streptomyces sp. PsTaAH-137 TaxID=1305830 RepID=UPI0035D11EC9
MAPRAGGRPLAGDVPPRANGDRRHRAGRRAAEGDRAAAGTGRPLPRPAPHAHGGGEGPTRRTRGDDHAGLVRATARSRFQWWLTHQLSTWPAQFDSPGCAGCGRCVTWCPVGIGITEEVTALAKEAGR